jgi:hypothetical protein
VTIEEVDDQDQDAHIQGGVIEEKEDMILEEIVEEYFIRKRTQCQIFAKSMMRTMRS